MLLVSIAVITLSMFATLVFSLDKPADCPHVAVEKWARAPTDTIYLRHCGGDVIDVEALKIIVSIDGSSYVCSRDDVYSKLNKSAWDLGDLITINTNDEFGVPLRKGDTVYLSLVDTDSKQLFRKAKVIPGGGGSGGWLPPAKVVNYCDGSATITDVIEAGDDSSTVYMVPKKSENETYSFDATGEEFNFGINMADYDYRNGEPVSNVKLKIVYRAYDQSFFGVKLRVYDAYPSPGGWYYENESMAYDNKVWMTYVTDISDCINTVEDLEGLRVKFEAVGNAADSAEKIVNVDYIALSFE